MQITSQQRVDDFTARGWWGSETLLSLFDGQLAQRPAHLALVDQFNRESLTYGAPQRLTFSEAAGAVDALSQRLHRAGLRRDDIVVTQLPNIVELPIVYLAAARIGVIVSPVPVQYGLYELGKVGLQLAPKAFITTSGFKGRNLAREHGPAFGADCQVLCFGDATAGTTFVSLEPAGENESAEWREYAACNCQSANDIFTICWTSGTTGEPKGVPRTHNQWIVSATSALDVARCTGTDVLLCPFPFTNLASIGGFLFPSLITGATVVLHHPLDLPTFLEQLRREHITYTIAPPALLSTLLKNPELRAVADLSSLRAIGSGGAPLSEWVVREYQERYGILILNLFGSNEGICLSAGAHDLADPALRAGYFPRFRGGEEGWCNPVARMVRTRLVDTESGEEVTRPGKPGELLIWGAPVFDGYWRSVDANAKVFSHDGYFHTGDLFEIAGEGDLERLYKYVGRFKDIIVRGGMKISPNEIDLELATHPAIAEVAVVGYPDDVLSERIGAVVVTKSGQSVTLQELIDFLRALGMATFKMPERLALVPQLPRNAMGKVQRNSLKQLFQEGA